MAIPSRRKVVRMLNGFILSLLLVSVLLWQCYTYRREPPLVQIGKISAIMNFSLVLVEGTVESDARQLRDGSLFFVVDDGTGTLPVFLDEFPETERLKAGSRVVVAGELRVGFEHNVSMQVSSSEGVVVESGPGGLAAIDARHVGETLCITGRVESVWMPLPSSKAPFRIRLIDQYGKLDVVHWLKSAREVQAGERLSILGKVNVYKGRTQLKVERPIDIQLLR